MKPEEAITKYGRLAERLAGEYADVSGGSVDAGDLEQEALLAIALAAPLYRSGTRSLKSFLRIRIRQALKECLRKTAEGGVSFEWVAGAVDGSGQVRASRRERCLNECAQRGGIWTRPLQEAVQREVVVSLDDELTVDEESSTRHDVVGAPAEQEALRERKERATILANRMATWPKAWRNVVSLRFEGLVLEEIGSRVGISAKAVQRVWEKAEKSVRGLSRHERLSTENR